MEDELQQLRHRIRSLETQLELATDQITDQEAREESFKKTEARLQQTVQDLKDEIRKAKERMEVVEVENIPVVVETKPVASYDTELVEQLQQEIEGLTDEVEKLENEKKELNGQLVERSKMLEEVQQLAFQFQSDLQKRERELAEMSAERDYLQKTYSEACRQIEALNREIVELSVPAPAPVASIGNNMFDELDRQRVVAEREFRKAHTQLEDARAQINMLQSKLRIASQNARSDTVAVEELEHYKKLLKAQHDKSTRLEEQQSLLKKQTNVLPADDQQCSRTLLEAKTEELALLRRNNDELEKQLQEARAFEAERLNLMQSNNILRRDLEIAKDQLKVYEGEPKRRKESLPPPTPKKSAPSKSDSITEDSTTSASHRDILKGKAFLKKYKKIRHIPPPEN
uniref:HOOK domain-containing protein n=1 Tax=Panagrellus redivivus TaxID=6233 RepID=A0A7E4ZZC1_PANRE